MENFQSWVEKHRDHIQKLETLLRMLDNDAVEVQQIKDIQEDIDNYIENSQEPDFFENEFIYKDIEETLEEKAELKKWLSHVINAFNIKQFKNEFDKLEGEKEMREKCQVSWSLIGFCITILASHWSGVIT